MTIDEARAMLDEIYEARYEGSKFEEDFLLGILDSIEGGYAPNESRSKILKGIHKKAIK